MFSPRKDPDPLDPSADPAAGARAQRANAAAWPLVADDFG